MPEHTLKGRLANPSVVTSKYVISASKRHNAIGLDERLACHIVSASAHQTELHIVAAFVVMPRCDRSGSKFTILIGAGSPRRGSKAPDQKIDEDLHLGSLMTTRRQQSVQRVDLRILCVLQQGLKQSLIDGAR